MFLAKRRSLTVRLSPIQFLSSYLFIIRTKRTLHHLICNGRVVPLNKCLLGRGGKDRFVKQQIILVGVLIQLERDEPFVLTWRRTLQLLVLCSLEGLVVRLVIREYVVLELKNELLLRLID